MTLSGATPPPLGHPPYAIMPYYRYTIAGKFSVQYIRGIACAPAPNGGWAGARGAINFQKIGFLQRQFFPIFILPV